MFDLHNKKCIHSSLLPLRISDFKHDFAFDPTYGYDLGRLLEVKAPASPPSDFLEFWQNLYRRVSESKPHPKVREVAPHAPRRKTFEVEFSAFDALVLKGWLDIPEDGVIESGLVMLHGYGGRGAPEQGVFLDKCAVFSFGCRGLSPSFHQEISSDPLKHVVHGLESRESYVIGHCVADVWSAVNVLVELYPQTEDALHLVGGSFGGGVGTLALVCEKRIRMAHFGVPTFGNHPLRVTLPCCGSGAAITQYWNVHPEVLQTLAYFDAATAAQCVHIPVLISPAMFDPSVPPPGQFAVANSFAGPKCLYIKKAGHFEYEGKNIVDRNEFLITREWFSHGWNSPLCFEALYSEFNNELTG